MKKLIFSFVAAFMFFAATASTPTSTPVLNDDLSAIEQDFSGLNALEQEVSTRNVTYNDLVAENSTLLNNVKENQDLGNALLGAGGRGDDSPLGIPSFWWGFCLGLVGLLVVVLVVDDSSKKEQVKKALIGCVVGSLTWIVLWLILSVLSVGASGG